MIYALILIFLIPILLKTIQTNVFSAKILLPTFTTYFIWFFLSFLLISGNINPHYYLYFFYPFPIGLLIYEIINTYVKRHNLVINKLCYYLIAFIVINSLINIFTRSYLSFDSSKYMSWVISGLNNNSFINSIEYKFNTFYYISTILGNYNIPLFYNTLLTYIMGILIYTFVILILEVKNKKMLNFYIQLPIILLIVMLVNSYSSLSGNWIIGVLIAIASLFLFISIFIDNESKENMVIFDLLLIFTMNFSITGLVVGALVMGVSKVIIFFKYKGVYQLWIFPFLFVYLLSIISNFNYKYVFLVLGLINTIFSLVLFLLYIFEKPIIRKHKYDIKNT